MSVNRVEIVLIGFKGYISLKISTPIHIFPSERKVAPPGLCSISAPTFVELYNFLNKLLRNWRSERIFR